MCNSPLDCRGNVCIFWKYIRDVYSTTVIPKFMEFQYILISLINISNMLTGKIAEFDAPSKLLEREDSFFSKLIREYSRRSHSFNSLATQNGQ